VPYPFAHPAAVLPLIRPMGRFGVASALVIGSMIPDAWYLVPGLIRADSHSALGLLWFCLPAGLLAYIAFEFLMGRSLRATRWHAVLASLMVGALTHLGWDALAHPYEWQEINVLQHASTVLGTGFIVWWCTGSLRLAALAGALLAVLAVGVLLLAPDLAALRSTLREAGAAAAWILGASLVAWRLISARAIAPRAPRAPSPRKPGR
jgi:hypothetical protein